MPGCKRIKALVLQDNNDIMEIDEEFEDPEKMLGKNKKISRAEKSRLAAKIRRDKENIEVENLIQLLPFQPETLSKLDKNSVMEVILNYINTKHYIQREMAALSLNNKDESKENEVQNQRAQQLVVDGSTGIEVEESSLMLEAMDGFLMLLDKKKNIMFVSEGVEKHLGIEQIHLLGKSLKHFIHPNDIPELRKQFNMKVCDDPDACRCKLLDFNPKDPSNGTNSPPHLDNNRMFYMRMKYFLKKGGSRTKHSGYTLVQWSGRLKMRTSSRPNGYTVDGLICICRPMQTNSVLEIRMDGNMFMSRHDLGMKFTFCDPRIITLIGYQPHEVIGKTAYQFHNPVDAPKVSSCHSNLIVKGSSVSKYYRFIGKNCDWVWVQTRATIIYNTNNVPQYIVCMNYIISEEEGQHYLQMEQEQPALPAPSGRGVAESSCATSCDQHSDAGYSSGHSPYSSSHASPCPMDGQHIIELNNAEDKSLPSDGNFPVNVFQEVAQTINSGTDEEVIEFLDILEKESQDQRERNKVYTSEGQPQQVIQTSNQAQPFIYANENNLQPLLQSGEAQTLDIIPGDENEIQQSREKMIGTQHQSVLQSLLAPSTSKEDGQIDQRLLLPTVNNNSYLPENSIGHTYQPMIDGGHTGSVESPRSRMSSSSSSPIQILSDSSQEPIDFISTDISDPLISDASIFREDSCQMSSPPGNGLLNVQVGVFNSADFVTNPQNGDSLPKEITDFYMQYCNSLADSQAQHLMSEFGHSGLMADFDQLSNQSSNESFSNSNLSNFNMFQKSVPSTVSGFHQSTCSDSSPQPIPTSSQGFQQSTPVTSSHLMPTTDLLRQYPLSVRTNLSVPCTDGQSLNHSIPVSQINSHSRLYSQQTGGPWNCSTSLQNAVSSSQYSLGMAPRISPAPNSPVSPAVTNLSSPISSVNSPFSEQTHNGLSQISSPMDQCHLSPNYSPLDTNGINHAVLPESTFSQNIVSQGLPCNVSTHVTSCNIICDSRGLTGSDSNLNKNHLNQSVSNGCILSRSDNNVHPNKQSMSELEKMLRGYSSPSHIFSNRNQLCSQQMMNKDNDSRMTSKSTLLQQMLTGQLSGEMYHAMERKQRQSDTVMRNVP